MTKIKRILSVENKDYLVEVMQILHKEFGTNILPQNTEDQSFNKVFVYPFENQNNKTKDGIANEIREGLLKVNCPFSYTDKSKLEKLTESIRQLIDPIG